jgi:hypothetical protein
MAISPLLMIAFSVIVMRRARSVGRRPWLWLLLLWLVTLMLGFSSAILTTAYYSLTSTSGMTDQELNSALLLPSLAGMLLGAIIINLAAGRIPVSKEQ